LEPGHPIEEMVDTHCSSLDVGQHSSSPHRLPPGPSYLICVNSASVLICARRRDDPRRGRRTWPRTCCTTLYAQRRHLHNQDGRYAYGFVLACMMEVRSRSGRDQRWVRLGGKERVTEVGRRGV